MYEVYYNKQDPKALAQSPNTNQGFTQNPQTQQGITLKQGIGITAAASRVLPATSRAINVSLKATGSLQKQQQFQRITKGIGFATTAFAVGLPVALGVEALSFGLNQYENYVTNQIETQNQSYRSKLQGAAINKFTGRGVRYG